MKKKVAILGAGLAGLNCAKNLEKNPSISIDLFEKESAIGGRIKTDMVDGFLLDHGFQVFLPNYPEAKKAFNYEKLNLNEFLPGAEINGSYIGDPLRNPSALIPTLFSSIGSIKDKLLILKLRNEKKTPAPNLSALDYLKDYGFSNKIIQDFFRPFFSGVFLNKELENDASFFLFLYRLFSRGYASLPQNGMQELPLNLAEQLTRTNIHLESSTEILDDQKLKLSDGEIQTYDFIVQAYPSSNTDFYSVTTDYFWTDEDNDSASLKLFTQTNFINHIAPVSAANPYYCPKGKSLYSVNSLINTSVDKISSELADLYPQKEFNFIKRYTIKKALPKKSDLNIVNGNKYQCSDAIETPSINGALASGRKVAKEILTQVGTTS